MTVRQIRNIIDDCWIRVIVEGDIFYDEREYILYEDDNQGKNLEIVIDKEVDFICSSHDDYNDFIDIIIK